MERDGIWLFEIHLEKTGIIIQSKVCNLAGISFFRPEPSLANVCKENLTKFPESGEIFAVKLENQEIVRAVRSDLIFKV